MIAFLTDKSFSVARIDIEHRFKEARWSAADRGWITRQNGERADIRVIRHPEQLYGLELEGFEFLHQGQPRWRDEMEVVAQSRVWRPSGAPLLLREPTDNELSGQRVMGD